jgi:hypothetical protein
MGGRIPTGRKVFREVGYAVGRDQNSVAFEYFLLTISESKRVIVTRIGDAHLDSLSCGVLLMKYRVAAPHL